MLLAMAAATEFCQALDVLNVTQIRAAQLFGVTPRHIRRWRSGDRHLPHAVGIVCRLLAAGAVTVDQIEKAIASVPARTNGGAKLAPRLVAPTPEQSVPAAALAVCALEPNACRWPCGDPKDPRFRFCGRPAAKGAYCEEHTAAAYMPRSRHDVVRQPKGPAVADHEARKLNGARG
jgi:hypothetical protein